MNHLSAGSPGRAILVDSCLTAPAIAPSTVLRPRLLAKLSEAELAPVTLVTGEPAAGKTSLLVQWAKSGAGERSVVWLTVPPLIAGEVMFWEYLLVAISPLGLHVDDLRAALLDNEPPGDAWLATLANRLGRLESRPVVIVDDLHEITSGPVLDSLAHLLEITPAGVAFVIATRRMPPWPLARWRLSGRMTEISSDDLRITSAEARELLESRGISLRGDEIDLLVERTEGWAGGIQLALLSLETSSDPAAFLSRFAAEDELLTTFLLRDVLAHQAEETSRFLLDISILDVATAEICDAIRESDDSAELLERCRTSNLFVTRTGTNRSSYRLHGLFRELLRSRLQFSDRDRFLQLHRRASDIFEEVGDLEQAIGHAFAAGDSERVSRLVIANAPGLAHQARFDELRRWASTVQTAGTAESSTNLLAVASALCFAGEANESLRLLDAIDEQTDRPPALSSQLRAAAYIVRGDVHLLPGIGRALRARATTRSPGELGAEGYGLFVEGVGTLLAGDPDAAGEILERADHPEHRPAPPAYIAVKSWAALAASERGDLTVAHRCVREALQRREELSSGDTAAVATAFLAAAELEWERNRLDESAALYNRARRSVPPMPWQAVLVECSRSRLSVSRGEPQQALEDLTEVGKLYLSTSGSPLLVARVAERGVDVCLRMGDADAALAWAHTHAGCHTGHLPWATRIRLAEVTEPDRREALIEEALGAPAPLPRLIDTLLVAATASRSAGDETTARSLVARALHFAEPERMIRRFVDAGPQVAALVGDLAADPRRSGGQDFSPFFAAEVFDAREGAVRVRAAPVVDELVEQLSARELDVLGLLAKGLSYTDMGRELFVSRNTIKSHVQHVYTKLGVASRTHAVELGRSLGLI